MKRFQRLTRILGAAALLLIGGAAAAPASAQARINKLSDVAFGTLSNFATDSVQAQSVCAYSLGLLGAYHVTASGSGTGGAFTLGNGAGATLAYEVQWNDSAGQSSGTALTSGSALTGQYSGALLSGCTLGAATTASLIVVIRATAMTTATAGSYSGVLTIILAPN